jgi:inosine/xanthosine triphosphatase
VTDGEAFVAVGSTNPVKTRATREAFERVGRPVDVAATSVDSGVSEQPWGRAETVRGAENRARRARREQDADLGVGLEGGVAERGTELRLVMWAAVTDGDRTAVGGGPSLRLPGEIATAVRDGAELGPLIDERERRAGVARAEGAAGLLSGGAMDRCSALRHAVAGALGPFVTDQYGSSSPAPSQ